MKKLILKTICLVAFAALTTTVANAQQKNDMAVGGNIVIGTGHDVTNLGIGAKFQWTAIDNLRFEPSITYFFKSDYVTMWDFSVNAHYMFEVGDNIYLYPLAGLGLLSTNVDFGYGFSASSTDFAFNFGGGVEYQFTSNLSANFELKFKITDFDRALFSFGIAYKL